jgi:hypothetical protein
VRLLAVPWAPARRAQLRDNLAQLLKSRHSERSVAQSKNPAALPFSFITGFLDFARNDIQIRQSERCVPNSEISPEDFLLT